MEDNFAYRTHNEGEKWERRYMALARLQASWSKDPSTQVGAVVVRQDGTVAAMGYNGFPRNVRDTPERLNDRAVKYEMAVHAELNAILQAREPLHGCSLYVWPIPPCARCACAIIQAGITCVVCAPATVERWAASAAIANEMFREAGVRVVPFIGIDSLQ